MTKLITHSKPVLWLVIITFFVNTIISQPVQAYVPFLPAPGKFVSLTPSFSPPLIRGLKVFKNNPFKFEFIMSQGDNDHQDDNGESYFAKQVFLKEEASKLVRYFLASLTVPEKDMWVNLSPYERNHIIPREFGITEMGKELLAQDYLLKQVTASVMYPEGDVGKEFWSKIYQEAYRRFGTTNVSINTFNKVWIVPQTAVVYENAVDNTAVIVESKLKVMLEEDYLALNKSSQNNSVKTDSDENRQLSNELIRQVILPLLDKEVNTGKNFAVLRQVYNSLILALWYKNKLKQSLISKGYVDRKKVNGVEVKDKNVDQEIYKQYLKSYKKGVYNYIKEEMSPTNEVIPRKYFSGGVNFESLWGDVGKIERITSGPDSAQLATRILKPLKMFVLTVGLAAAFVGASPSIAGAQQTNGLTAMSSTARDLKVEATVKRGDTVSGIFGKEIRKIQASLDPSKKLDLNTLLKSGLISIVGKDGKTIQNPNYDEIAPDQKVILDLTNYSKPVSPVAASTPLDQSPPPVTPLPPINVTVKPGNTISGIFSSSPKIPKGHQLNVYNLIQSGNVLINGEPAINHNPDLIFPGQVITFNLKDFVETGGPIVGPEPIIARNVGSAVAPDLIHSSHLSVKSPPAKVQGVSGGPPDHQLKGGAPGGPKPPAITTQAAAGKGGGAAVPAPGPTAPQPAASVTSGPLASAVTFPPPPAMDTSGDLELLKQAIALNTTGTSSLNELSQTAKQIMALIHNPLISDHDKQLLARKIGISIRYQALMKLLSGPKEQQPYRVLYSIKPGEEYKPLRIFNTRKEFTDFILRFSTEGKFFQVMAPQQGPLEISKLFNTVDFKEVTSPKQLEQMTDDGIHYFAYSSGRDSQGAFDGVIAGGVRSSEDKVAFMQAIKYSASVLNELNQNISVLNSTSSGLIIGAYVARDAYGLIQQSVRYITKDDIKESVETMPDGNTRVVLRINVNGRWVPLKPYYLGNSPYEEFSIMQEPEEALLTGSDYRMAFDSNNYSQVDPLTRGEIVLGGNFLTIEDIKLHMMRAAATKNEKLNELALQDAKRRGLLQFALAPLNIALSVAAPGIPTPTNAVADLLYRAVFKSPISELGPPTGEEIAETELGPWLLSERQRSDTSYKQGHDWEHLTPQERSDLKAEAIAIWQKAVPENETASLFHYLKVRQDQGKQSYLLDTVTSILNIAGTLEGGLDSHLTIAGTRNAGTAGSFLVEYQSPNNKALAFLLSNAGWALSGQVPIPQAIAAAMGKPLPFVPVNQLNQPGSFAAKLFSYVTPVIDLKSVMNGFVSDPTELPFVNSPRNIRLNIYIAGIDLKEILFALDITERLELQLKKIFEDPNNLGYVTKDHLITSDAVGLNEAAIESLFYKASNVTIPLEASVNGIKVPIYLIVDPQTKEYQILILTKAGIDAKLKIIAKQLENVRQFMKMPAESGVRTDISPPGGTLGQRPYNGVRRSFGGETGLSNQAYSWDNFESNNVYMVSGQRQIAQETWKTYKEIFDTQISVYGHFVGMPELLLGSNGQNVSSQGNVAATVAAILNLVNDRELYGTQDPQADEMIKVMAQWLISQQQRDGGFRQDTGKNTNEPLEVAALVYSALLRTGHTSEAGSTLAFARDNIDPQTGLLKRNAGQPGLSADATLRWYAVLHAEGTLTGLYKGDTNRYIYVWRNFIDRFEVRDILDSYYSERHVMIDNLDAQGAAHRHQPGERIGDSEVTANAIGRLREHQALLIRLGETWVPGQIDMLKQSLRSFQHNRASLPASTAPGHDSGLGYEYPQGRDSLAAITEKTLSVDAPVVVNPFVRGGLRQNMLSPVKMPTQVLSREAQTTNTFTAGEQAKTQTLDLADMLQERATLERNAATGKITPTQSKRLAYLVQRLHNAHLDWFNPNGREFSFVNEEGAIEHKVIYDSSDRIAKAEKLAQQQLIDAQNYTTALRGEGPYPNGAVALNHFTRQGNQLVMGLPIRNIQGSLFHGEDMRQRVLRAIHALPVPERERIMSKQFANFVLKLDLGNSKKHNIQEVMVTVIFPMDKDILDTISSENDIDVYRNGHLTLKVTPDEVVVPLYNNLWVETHAIKHSNLSPYETRPANAGVYVAQIQKDLKAGHLPMVGLSATYDYHYIDPHTIQVLNPNTVRMRKLVLGYDQSLGMESFGLYPEYVERVTVKDIAKPQRDAFGYVQHEKVYDNGTEENLPELTMAQAIERMAHPVPSQLPTIDNDATLSADHRTSTIQSHDLIHDTYRQMTIDNVHHGRKASDDKIDVLVYSNGHEQRINVFTRYLYSPLFHYGYIPYATLLYNGETGKLLTTVLTSNFDPVTRRLTGEGIDHSKGDAKTTFVWDWRWEAPVETDNVDALGRQVHTTTDMNRNDTHYTAKTTVGRQQGSITAVGDYDLQHRRWETHKTNWLDEEGGLALERNTVFQTPFGRTIFTLSPFDDGLDFRYETLFNEDGIENGGERDIFNPVTNQWVPQFGYSGYHYENGRLIRNKKDIAHQKTSAETDDIATGLVLDELAPQGAYKNPFGISFEGPVATHYAYDGPYALVSGHVTNDRGETRILDGLSTSLLNWQIQSPDHRIYYEDTDPTHRGRTAAAHAYFDARDNNVPRVQGSSEHRTDNHFRAPTASNILDIDSLPDSLSSNYREGKLINRISVAGSFDASRMLGTSRISIDEILSNNTTTVVKEEVLADNGDVVKTVVSGYQYGRDRLLWKIIGTKKIVLNWSEAPDSYSVKNGIADSIDVYEINESGENVKRLYSAQVLDYNSVNGIVTFRLTHYFGDNSNQTWSEMVKMAANGDILLSIADLKNDQGQPDQKYGYYFYPSDQDRYADLTQDNGRTVNLVEAGKALDASKEDYWYFLANSQDNEAYDDIETTVTDTQRHQVTFSSRIDRPKYFNDIQSSGKIQELPFAYPYNFNVISHPSSKLLQRESSAVVNLRSLQGRNPFVIPIQWLADAGLDPTGIASVVVHYKGNKDVPISVSELKSSEEQTDLHITKREDPKVFLDELKKFIADARIHFNSNDTVTVDMGWNVDPDEERNRIQFGILGDGRVLMARYDRNEKLGKWTPLTTIYSFDVLNEKERPTANVYSGYPGLTVAEELRVVNNGFSRLYFLSNGVGIPSVQQFEFGHAGNMPERTTWKGFANIIIPKDYGGGIRGLIRAQTYNDFYGTLARGIFPGFNPDASHDTLDAEILDEMKNRATMKPHPVSEFGQNTPFWKFSTGENLPLSAGTADLVATARSWQNKDTGLIPLTNGTEDRTVDVAKEGDLLSTLILTGRPEAIQLAEGVLLNDSQAPKTFGFFDLTRGGTIPVVDSLDIDTGAPQRHTPELKNPQESTLGAKAQASIANAVYLLYKKTGNPYAGHMAIKLVKGLFTNFYSSDGGIGAFSEAEFIEKVSSLSLEWIGRPSNYYTKTNSQIYLLLRTMQEDTELDMLDSGFRQAVKPKRESLENFFDKYLMPRVKDQMIVPYGVYRRQNGDVAYGEIPGSSTDTWDYFIEAAREMGRINDQDAIQLLDMLARAHGVQIGPNVGLDVAIGPRDRVVSPGETSMTLRVAKLIGYTQAETGLGNAIAAYSHTKDNLLPQVIGIDPSKVDPHQGLDSGDLSRIYPLEDGKVWVWPSSLSASAEDFMGQRSGVSVYNAAFKDRAQTAFLPPFQHSLIWVALAYLPLAAILLAPYINLLTGFVTKRLLKLRKYFLFGQVKASIPEFDLKDISAAYDLIIQTIELTNEKGKQISNTHQRVHILHKEVQGSRSLDILSAQGFTALIALLKYIQKEDPTIIQDDQLKEVINNWSKIFYEEFEKQAKYWRTKGSWGKSIRRMFGIRSKKDEEDIYTNPRYQPATLINLYMWEEVNKLRNAVANHGDIKEEVKESIARLNNGDQFTKWAQVKAKETRHPFILGLGRNLFLVYWILIAAAFGRSEITYIQGAAHSILYNQGLMSWANHLIGFSSWGVLATGIISILSAYMIAPRFKPLRALLTFGGLALGAGWMMGMVGDYKINFLLPEALSHSTGSHLIIGALVHQVSQQTGLFLMGAAALVASWVLDFIQGEKESMRWLRRAFGGLGAGAMAYVLSSGLHITETATGLAMYSTILALAAESIARLYSAHSIMGTSLRYYYAPQYYFEGIRAFTQNFLVKTIYFAASILTIFSIFPQIQSQLAVGVPISWMQMAGGFSQLIITLILGHYSILLLTNTTIGAASYALPKYLRNLFGIKRSKDNGTKNEIPPSVIKAPIFENAMPPDPQVLTELWQSLIKSHPDAVRHLYDYINIRLGAAVDGGVIESQDNLRNSGTIESLLQRLSDYEQSAVCPITHMPLILALRQEDIISNNVQEQQELRTAFYIREYISLRTGSNGTTQESFIFLTSLATQWGQRGKNAQLLIISNNIKDHFNSNGQPSKEYELKHRIVVLWDMLTRRENDQYLSQVVLNDTPAVNKVGSETNAIPFIRPDAVAEFMLDRQVISHWADRIADILSQFNKNSNTPASEYLVAAAGVRRPAVTSREAGAAVSIVEASEASFGHFVVGTESANKGGWGAYGWAGAQAYDYNESIIEFFKQGLSREPISPYQMDSISEDIARAHAIGINAQDRGLKPTFSAAEINAKKMREETIDQLWGSWIRWASGWIQLAWNPTMQRKFFLGNIPLSNREYRLGLAGLFSLAPLAALYVFIVPFGIIWGVTFFVGINMGFFLVGLLYGQASIFGSWLMRIINNGILSGTGRWVSDRPRDLLTFGGTQFWIHASAVFRALFLGVSPVFNLMKGSSKGEESHWPHFGYTRNIAVTRFDTIGPNGRAYLSELINRGILQIVSSTEVSVNPDVRLDKKDIEAIAGPDSDKLSEILKKWQRGNNVKFDQTYFASLVPGFAGVCGYLYALSILDILNVGLVYVLYVLQVSGLMSSFSYHEKIGQKTHWELPAKALTHVITALSLFGLVIGINQDGQGGWAVIGGLVFTFMGLGTVIWHNQLRGSAKTSDRINKLRRVLSEISRTAWLSLLLQLPFVVVKIAGVLYVEIGTRTALISLPNIMWDSLTVAVLAGILIGVGKVKDLISGYRANNHYPRMLRDLNNAEGRLTLQEREKAEDLLKEYRHDIGDKYWLKAKETRREFKQIINSSNNNPIPPPAMSPALPEGDDAMVVRMAQQITSNMYPLVDMAMEAPKFNNRLTKGGIDLGRTVVNVESSGDLIQTAFDDPAMLRLLLNSDGLTPIIYDVKVMTPSMVDHFVGLDY